MKETISQSEPALVHSSRWKKIVIITAIAATGVIASIVIGEAPLIPSWQAIKAPALGTVAVVVLAVISWRMISAWRASRPGNARLVDAATSIVCAVVAVAVICLILLDAAGPDPLRGEEVIATICDNHSGDQIFVYHLSEIPDGFISTRIALRLGILPIEKTILVANEPYTGFEKTDSGLQLMLGIGGCARYNYSNGGFSLAPP